MQKLPVVTDLPDDMMRAIGRVIVEYAMLELQLSRVIYDLLKVDPKAGRLAVREPRATDRLEVIFDLADLRGLDLEHEKPIFRKAIQTCVTERDRIAHGVWVRGTKTNELMLRLTKGSWQPVKGQRGKTKRLVTPEATPYSVADITAIGDTINLTSHRVAELREAIGSAVVASKSKRE